MAHLDEADHSTEEWSFEEGSDDGVLFFGADGGHEVIDWEAVLAEGHSDDDILAAYHAIEEHMREESITDLLRAVREFQTIVKTGDILASPGQPETLLVPPRSLDCTSTSVKPNIHPVFEHSHLVAAALQFCTPPDPSIFDAAFVELHVALAGTFALLYENAKTVSATKPVEVVCCVLWITRALFTQKSGSVYLPAVFVWTKLAAQLIDALVHDVSIWLCDRHAVEHYFLLLNALLFGMGSNDDIKISPVVAGTPPSCSSSHVFYLSLVAMHVEETFKATILVYATRFAVFDAWNSVVTPHLRKGMHELCTSFSNTSIASMSDGSKSCVAVENLSARARALAACVVHTAITASSAIIAVPETAIATTTTMTLTTTTTPLTAQSEILDEESVDDYPSIWCAPVAVSASLAARGFLPAPK